MAEAATEEVHATSYSNEDKIREIHAGSYSDNYNLAKKIVERYLQNPIPSLERQKLIKSALKKFHYGRITKEGRKKMERDILNRYGPRARNIINLIEESAKKKDGIEETIKNLGVLQGGLKTQLEIIIKNKYPEILAQRRVLSALDSIEGQCENNDAIQRIKEGYSRLVTATFGMGRGVKQDIKKVRSLWNKLERNLAKAMAPICEAQEISSLVANANYAGG